MPRLRPFPGAPSTVYRGGEKEGLQASSAPATFVVSQVPEPGEVRPGRSKLQAYEGMQLCHAPYVLVVAFVTHSAAARPASRQKGMCIRQA